MPNVVPVQAISIGGWTSWIVEVIVPGPARQRKTEPCSRPPSKDIDLTSGFHRGQLSRSVRTSQTASGLAAISISSAAPTGAFRLTSTDAQPTRGPLVGSIQAVSHSRKVTDPYNRRLAVPA